MHGLRVPWIDFYKYLYIADRNSIVKTGRSITGASYKIDIHKFCMWSKEIDELFYTDAFKDYFDIEFNPFIHIKEKQNPGDGELSDFDEECLKGSLGTQTFPEFDIEWEDVMKVHEVPDRDIVYYKLLLDHHNSIKSYLKNITP